MTRKKFLLVVAGVLVFGPPFCFTLISLLNLFMYLTEPWGWLALFLLFGLSFGTILVGVIIRYGGKHVVGGFKPSERHPGWDEPAERPAAAPTFRYKG